MSFPKVRLVLFAVSAAMIPVSVSQAKVSPSLQTAQNKSAGGPAQKSNSDGKISSDGQAPGGNPGDALAKAAQEYKSALNNLVALYETDLKKTTERNTQLKDLLDKGIVSRVEFEKSSAAVAEAQAKVDSVRKQIASTDADMAAAKNEWSAANDLGVPWSTGNAKIDGLIRHYGLTYGVDPFLVYCVARQESGFSSSALSPKGAQGVMQLMPDTGARYGVTNPFDPEQNIRAGVHYLKDLLTRFHGNIDLALAGYNAGEGAVMKSGNTVPNISETQYYVRSIGKRYSSRDTAGKSTAASKKKTNSPSATTATETTQK